MSGAWQQLEQLLTCAICMDRFKNPKLLPCQHTYCCDPCMEGLVDYARRQIKCPECRTEHRIPYNGVQTLPTNVTLMRFLELHRSMTGEEPEPEEAMMGRCSVCSEKQHLISCHHCNKKICADCKEAHLDVMRREISRICSNVRRSVSRLEDTLKETKKNEEKLITNCVNVQEEISDIINRSVKDLEKLKERLEGEVKGYEEVESGTLLKLSDNLDQEVTTINANCDVVEKYIDEDHDWTDVELVEYKEIFVKTLEFLRNFDADTTDYGRRVRLNILTDTEQVHKMLAGFLELKIQASTSVNQSLAPAGQTLPNALMRSQSDHRLASQFKKVDSRSMLDISQRDGASDEERGQGKSDILRRYGLLGDEDSHGGSRHGYKSKYVRDLLQEQDSLMRPSLNTASRIDDEKTKEPEPLPKVFDVDGAVRAPLSGIVKIDDSGKFMERVFESEKKAKTKKVEKENLRKMQEQQQQLTQMAQQPELNNKFGIQISLEAGRLLVVCKYHDAESRLEAPRETNPRTAYIQKGECKLSIGKRGSETGSFTWPRSVAVGPDGSLVVADSSNHRVQVFDSNGRFLHAFGKQGSADGELDNPAGVAVNRIGQIIVSDRYNNRVQIFDASGRFIRAFGGDGRSDGKFQCPWGLTTDSLGFIYVCDKENHRVQVFQSDGSFVGKMGSVGCRPGCLEHPSYIAVSSTNRVIVSDTNNHRVQVFDVNGKCQFTFGAEGSEEGLFRFPRGIAVDDQGYIIVSDSGNNRIQVFQPDGSFIKAFGSWGAESGKFKGLEDLAVSSKGDIVACDRENHRIQVF
ncbi:RING finger protein nhl-1 [Galendromus occidentalis]|uniref:RING finger protein nhl-1 n=1 Tax=Galendromus occidentalis TaxID=34638 RepID=A0AAJ7SE62_9ACAR|nr:RING finger protein nhl-1 [Galendromus occidentalis]